LDSGDKRLLEFPAVEQGAMPKLVEASSVIAGILREPPFSLDIVTSLMKSAVMVVQTVLYGTSTKL
jgi:hypothetical protein